MRSLLNWVNELDKHGINDPGAGMMGSNYQEPKAEVHELAAKISIDLDDLQYLRSWTIAYFLG